MLSYKETQAQVDALWAQRRREIAALYAAGTKVVDIAKMAGCTPAAVYATLEVVEKERAKAEKGGGAKA